LRSHGADETVPLTPNLDLVASFKQGGSRFDVVIGYLNGPPAEAAIQAMAIGSHMVQLGSLLGPGITVHAQTARRASLDVLGFAYHHAPLEQQAAAYGALCDTALAGVFDIETNALPAADFDVAWHAQNRGNNSRYVLRPC
jgi:NADPH:quinone reductase-like Zn-dependent oxidoreductase